MIYVLDSHVGHAQDGKEKALRPWPSLNMSSVLLVVLLGKEGFDPPAAASRKRPILVPAAAAAASRLEEPG